MPALPSGMVWAADGRIDPAVAEAEAGRPLSLYVHVPFCRVRCGYCDFNTYTTGFGPGADPHSYAASVLSEADLAVSVLQHAGFSARPASTVFFGGGTPTMLAPRELAAILRGLQDRFGLVAGAEVTTEANPETVDQQALEDLAKAGFTRVSFGMQSAAPHVLATLDRLHRPERVPQVVTWAKQAGLQASVDLIYGTPGESLQDWRISLDAAIAMEPDHISAYALVVEPGTKMGAQVARGELAEPDPDSEATKYEIADQVLASAGYRWYEISNFARIQHGEEHVEGTQLSCASQHNLAYWRDWDWWGFGPGAHSHLGRARWWNVKHPRVYAHRLATGASPAQAGEIVDDQARELERVMLAVRTAQGVSLGPLDNRRILPDLVAQGLIEAEPAHHHQVVLTLKGRLLADLVTRELTEVKEP